MNRLIITLLLLFAAVVFPSLDYASHDLRMLQTFSLDEAAFANQVLEMRAAGSFAVDGFTYGSIYPYLALILSGIYGLFADVTHTSVIVILRLISLSAALGTAVVVWSIAGPQSNYITSLIPPGLVLTVPIVLRWTTEIHPDVLQLFFLTCALKYALSLSRGFSARSALLAPLFAGLAMGTKYGGALLMPTILLALALGLPGGLRDVLRNKNFWSAAVLSGLTFVVTYAATNPYAVLSPSHLLADLDFAGRIVSDAQGGSGHWFAALFSPGLSPIVGLGLIASVYLIANRTWFQDRAIVCLVFWMITYVVFLMVNVRFIAGQYLLPVVSTAALILHYGISMSEDRPRRLIAMGAALILVALQGVSAYPTVLERSADVGENPVIEAGLWLSDRYSEDTTVLFDTYAYVPSKFDQAETYFGLSYPIIATYQPDIVVTRSSVADRYKDPNDSDHFRLTDNEAEQADFLYLDPQRYRDIHYTYRYLEGGLTDYSLERDFGHVTVYALAKPAKLDNKRERWEQISVGQKSGGIEASVAAQAYEKFGEIHMAAENWAEAKAQFARAAGLDRSRIVPRYRYAVALARQDSLHIAEDMIGELEGVTGKPADLWTKLGWDYYEMGRYEASRRVSRRALDLDATLAYPRYNIALTYLVENRAADALSAYRDALSVHPLPAATTGLLRKLVESDDLQPAARRVAERVIEGAI